MSHQTKIQNAINVLESHDMLEEAERLMIIADCCRCQDCLEFKSNPETDCDHKWVSADNEVVSGGEVCIKCHSIRETPTPAGGKEEA